MDILGAFSFQKDGRVYVVNCGCPVSACRATAFTFSARQSSQIRGRKRLIMGYRQRDAHQKSEHTEENKFSAYGEQVQKERRTCSKGAENKFKTCRDAHQRKFLCPTEKIPLGKRIALISLPFVKGHRRLVLFLAAYGVYHLFKGNVLLMRASWSALMIPWRLRKRILAARRQINRIRRVSDESILPQIIRKPSLSELLGKL